MSRDIDMGDMVDMVDMVEDTYLLIRDVPMKSS